MKARSFLLPLLALLCAACGEPPTIVLEVLQVVNMTPSHGAQCVTTDPAELNASVTFSDDVEHTTLDGNLFVRPQGGTPLPATISYDKRSQTAQLRLLDPLEFEQRYELVATEGIEGTQHGALPAQVVASFQTIAAAGCY